MIKIYFPNNNVQEREYIIDLLLSEFLGLEIEKRRYENADSKGYIICTPNGGELLIDDSFFRNYFADLAYLNSKNIPKSIFFAKNKYTMEKDIPVIFGTEKCESYEVKKIHCGIDIFASAFFMLSRWEEYVVQEKDQHDRFSATSSLALKCDFLHRPVVNEYVEMLWNMLIEIEPSLKRKSREFRLLVSHDVDKPFQQLLISPARIIINTLKQIMARKFIPAVQNLLNWIKVRAGSRESDLYFTFNEIMEISERFGIKSAFYFLPTGSPEQGRRVNLSHRLMRRLLKDVSARGHEIGIHGHYDTMKDGKEFEKQCELLQSSLKKLGLPKEPIGGRQHYLRWANPETFRIYARAGLTYDTTLGYADYIGFRCGVCYEYPVFDILERKKLSLLERPLIAMDCTVTDERYMNLGTGTEAKEMLARMKKTCEKYNGDFTLLWHNTYFVDQKYSDLYIATLSA